MNIHVITHKDEAGAQEALQDVLGNRPALMATVSGSALYGTATNTSDDDIRAAFLPTKVEILTGRTSFGIDGNKENLRMSAGDIDVSAVSLQRYLALIGKLDMISTELLFAAQHSQFKVCENSWAYDLIWNAREKLLAGSASSAIGHASQRLGDLFPKSDATLSAYRSAAEILGASKAKRMIDDPAVLEKLQAIARIEVIVTSSDKFSPERTWEEMTDEERSTGKSPGHSVFVKIGGKRIGTGTPMAEALATVNRPLNRKDTVKRTNAHGQEVIWKDAYQAIRLLHQVIELHETRELVFPRPEAPLLKSIRAAEVSKDALVEMIKELMERVADAEAQYPFADTPCNATWTDIICQAHEYHIRHSS